MNLTSRIILPALAASLLGTLASACDPCDHHVEPAQPEPLGLDGRDVFLWIGADRDAPVYCSASLGCDDGDNNYALEGELRVSSQTSLLAASYVHFHLPALPPGTEIVEAYVELYHGATNGDGTSDDRCLPLAPAGAPWHVEEITWNNQPNAVGAGLGNPFTISLRSDAWSGTGNIAEHVQKMFADPASSHGFAVFAAQGPDAISKGFHSNNSHTRTKGDLGLAPRLLVRARLPDDAQDADFFVPDLSVHNDLPFGGENVVMARAMTGDGWDPTWDVAIERPGFFCAP